MQHTLFPIKIIFIGTGVTALTSFVGDTIQPMIPYGFFGQWHVDGSASMPTASLII